MSEEWIKYTKDPRPICKYASKCYQKNTEHVTKFKHPPKRYMKVPDSSPASKRFKLQNSPNPPRRSPSPADEVLSEANQSDSIINDDEETTPKICIMPKKVNLPIKNTLRLQPYNSPTSQPCKSDASITMHDIPTDKASFIKDIFQLEMPKDFYNFWEFCVSIANSGDVKNVFKAVNLFPVGPFDVLLGNLPIRDEKNDYHLHWRYYYDPPEFQTLFMSPGSSGFHMGYYRDSPDELPCFVASNEAAKSCTITVVAENIFGAVLSYLETTKKRSPFTSIACQKIITQLKKWIETNDFSLESNTASMKKRQKTVVTKTFHGAGIVVPCDTKTELGYRPLIEKDVKIKALISNVIDASNEHTKDKAFAALQPIINMANIATDECDFGTGLELGIDFFCAGDPLFDATSKQLLTIAYSMLSRELFAEIAKAHFLNRRKGSSLSIADL